MSEILGGKLRSSGGAIGHRTFATLLAVLGVFLVGALPASAQTPDNLGSEFWLGFPNNAARSTELTLFITGPDATTGTVAIPGLAFAETFTVTPGTVTSVPLPANAQMTLGENTEDKGIQVTAGKEVAVYGLNRSPATTDAYLGLPLDVLGTEHTVMAWGPGAIGASEFSVVAATDDTVVTITPSVAASGHPAGTPYDVTLDQGQEYQLMATNPDDLTGTKVSSTAPVAVFAGHVCSNIPSSNFVACDHVVEQLAPDSTWGRSFLTVPLATRQNGDTFKFLANQDGTEIRVNGTVVATLNAGQQHQQIIDGNSQIDSNNPIFVSQFSNSSSFDGVTSDPFMMMMPPFEQFQTGYTITTPASGFNPNFVNLVVPNSAVGIVEVDGTPVPASDYTPIGTSGYQGAQVAISLGSHTITGDGQPFGAFVYGFASFDSYGYPGGLLLGRVATVTSVDLTPETAINPVNTEHCVTAKVTDQNGGPVLGVRVDFVVSGANSTSGSVNSDANGDARFCYTGNNAGNDTITGSVGALSDQVQKTWGDAADLAVSQTASRNGNSLIYTITVTNNGPSAASGTTLTSTLPAGVPVRDIKTSQGSCTGLGTNQAVCSLGDVPVGGTVTIQITVRPRSSGTLTNTVSVGGNLPDPNAANNSATDTRSFSVRAGARRDRTKPRVRVAGVAGVGSSCVRTGFSARFRIREPRLRRVAVFLDGRRVMRTRRKVFRVRVNAASMRSGRHQLRAVAVDRAGNRRVVRRAFRRCARPAAVPHFTG